MTLSPLSLADFAHESNRVRQKTFCAVHPSATCSSESGCKIVDGPLDNIFGLIALHNSTFPSHGISPADSGALPTLTEKTRPAFLGRRCEFARSASCPSTLFSAERKVSDAVPPEFGQRHTLRILRIANYFGPWIVFNKSFGDFCFLQDSGNKSLPDVIKAFGVCFLSSNSSRPKRLRSRIWSFIGFFLPRVEKLWARSAKRS